MSRATVVGGGPAGLAAAMALQRTGVETEVIERRQDDLDQACGEGLLPPGPQLLEELGVDLVGCGVAIRGIRYSDQSSTVAANLPRPGLGVRRTTLRRRMKAAAIGAGVTVREGVEAIGLERSRDRFVLLTSVGERSDLVVAADGRNSKLRHWAGLEQDASKGQRVGLRRHYRWREGGRTRLAEESRAKGQVEVFWTRGAEAYLTPIAEREFGVAMLTQARALRATPGPGPPFDRLLRLFPDLSSRLAAAEPTTQVLGAAPLAVRAAAVRRHNLVLVGDSSVSLDAVTGEGLALAFREARLLGGAVEAGDLSRYEGGHRRIVFLPRLMTRLVLTLTTRPRLRRQTLRLFSAAPILFGGALALLCGRQAGGRRNEGPWA